MKVLRTNYPESGACLAGFARERNWHLLVVSWWRTDWKMRFFDTVKHMEIARLKEVGARKQKLATLFFLSRYSFFAKPRYKRCTYCIIESQSAICLPSRKNRLRKHNSKWEKKIIKWMKKQFIMSTEFQWLIIKVETNLAESKKTKSSRPKFASHHESALSNQEE